MFKRSCTNGLILVAVAGSVCTLAGCRTAPASQPAAVQPAECVPQQHAIGAPAGEELELSPVDIWLRERISAYDSTVLMALYPPLLVVNETLMTEDGTYDYFDSPERVAARLTFGLLEMFYYDYGLERLTVIGQEFFAEEFRGTGYQASDMTSLTDLLSIASEVEADFLFLKSDLVMVDGDELEFRITTIVIDTHSEAVVARTCVSSTHLWDESLADYVYHSSHIDGREIDIVGDRYYWK